MLRSAKLEPEPRRFLVAPGDSLGDLANGLAGLGIGSSHGAGMRAVRCSRAWPVTWTRWADH
jgi:hypothetical protein